MQRRSLLLSCAAALALPIASVRAAVMRTDEMEWVLAEVRAPDHVFLLRFCKIPRDFPRERFPVRLNVFWTAAQPASRGMPSPEDAERMSVFEDRIVAATEAGDVAVLPMVVTGRGEREFVFYVRSETDFLECLNEMPQEAERYPIEIHRHDDPGWQYFDKVVASVGPGVAR